MAPRRQVIACIVGSNCLGSRYIAHLLRGRTGIRLVRQNQPGAETLIADGTRVVFLLHVPELEAPPNQYVRTLRARFRKGRILAISRPLPAGKQRELLSAGIDGVVGCEEADVQLAPAILAVAAGQTWARAEALREYAGYLRSMWTREGRALTKMEAEVLELLERKLSNKEIATILHISESTVKFHLANVYHKLKVRDRHEAAEWSSWAQEATACARRVL